MPSLRPRAGPGALLMTRADLTLTARALAASRAVDVQVVLAILERDAPPGGYTADDLRTLRDKLTRQH